MCRVSSIYHGNYLSIFDYFQNIDGEPLIMILRLHHTDLEKNKSGVALPNFVEIIREITDEEEYLARNLSRIDFKMNEKDKQLL